MKIELTKRKIRKPPCIMPALCEFWTYSGGYCLKDCETLKMVRKVGFYHKR